MVRRMDRRLTHPGNIGSVGPPCDEITQRVVSYSKHMTSKTFSGIATFFKANLCNDWRQIDVALIGLPTDAGLTQRTGARHGPREMRNQSCNVFYYNPLTKIIPFEMAARRRYRRCAAGQRVQPRKYCG